MTIKKYRKKPIVISAVQWTGENLKEVIDFIGLHLLTKKKHEGLKIFTLEGVLEATVGDFIIKGIKGEFYPCKPDIFMATYDETKEEDS